MDAKFFIVFITSLYYLPRQVSWSEVLPTSADQNMKQHANEPSFEFWTKSTAWMYVLTDCKFLPASWFCLAQQRTVYTKGLNLSSTPEHSWRKRVFLTASLRKQNQF